MVQADNIKFEKISIEEGLSQSVVECILQDYLGFMWFGTQDGLNKYDGYKFTVYKNEPDNPISISNNYIRSIYEDKNNNLWIGTQLGLNRYDREKDCFENHKNVLNILNGISSYQIRALYQDKDNILWIGTYGGGLVRYDYNENILNYFNTSSVNLNSLSYDLVTAIFEDKKANLWVGTWGGGLNLFNINSGDFTRFANPNNDTVERKTESGRISSIFEDQNGSLLIGTNDGIYLFKDEKFINHYTNNYLNPKSLSNDLISQIIEDSSGDLWIGTREGGINLFKPDTGVFISYKNEKDNALSISNNSVASIYEDRSGIVWVGTFGGGLNKFNRNSKKIKHFFCEPGNPNSLNSNKVYCFCEDSENNLWIGTRDCGLNKFDREKNTFVHYKNDPLDPDSLSNDTITAIVEDDYKNIWIATSGGGLNKFDPIKNKFHHYKNNPANCNSLGTDTIFSLEKDKSSILWIGTAGKGLNKFDIIEEEFTHYVHDEKDEDSISSNRIRTILTDNRDFLWIGTDNGGLNKFDKKTEKFCHYKKEPGNLESLNENTVITVFKDSSEILWIGTMNSGMSRFDPEMGKFKRYNVRNGLPNDCVVGILEDRFGYLWISTNKGLSKFNPIDETFRNYDVQDGFQSNEFNPWAHLKLKSGELAFGGINGFNLFIPEDLKDNLFIPPVIITDFQIFNKSMPVDVKDSPLKKSITLEKEITLSYKDSVFSFEFASLDFNIPGKNQYAYMLEGFDKEWVYSGSRRFATYTNLNADEYIFRVKASNNDYIWNETGCEIKLTITPPFWQTWWFRTLGALAIAGTAGRYYQNKLNKVIIEKNAQEEFTKRLIDVQENDRKRIGAELHDSIGNDLLITKNKLLLSLRRPEDNKYLLNSINEVSGIISEVTKDIREISYTLHPYQIERLGISKAMKSILDRTAKSTDISFISNIDDIDKILAPEIEISLYRIIQECINNIIKHSKANEVLLNINKGSNDISVLISDNGVGFVPERVKENSSKYGFGLTGIMERIKLFNGKLTVDSGPGNGTSITIHIPFH